MSYTELLNNLHQKFPSRLPGSNELTRVTEHLKEIAAKNPGTITKTETIPVFSPLTSISLFSVISLCALLVGLAIPLAGLVIQLTVWIIYSWEIIGPTLSRIKPEHSTNLILQIPARSKELQKIYLTSALSTDKFNYFPAGFLTGCSTWVLPIFVFLPFLFQALNFILKWPAGLYLDLFTLIILTVLPFIKGKLSAPNSLNNSAVLMEIVSILSKSKPATTSVTIILSGARSLNSGILKIYRELKKNELAYLINLIDLPEQQINIAATEGPVVPLRSDPVLLELLSETAGEKNITVRTNNLPEITETYPLKLLRHKAVTVTNPLLENSNKDLKELLIGLIRKVDHP